MVKKKKKKSYYQRNDFLENEFIVDEKMKSLPIIKNGHDTQLKAIRIRNKNISLTNTCGFDSVFQVCLCALQDRELLREYVQETENDFLKFVSNVKEKGLSQHSYRLRAQILANIFPGRNYHTMLYKLTARLQQERYAVASLSARLVLKNCPSAAVIALFDEQAYRLWLFWTLL